MNGGAHSMRRTRVDNAPMKAIPKTSKRLLSKPPRREPWTRSRSHLPRAIPAIISSTTFPKVAFNRPPTAWLVLNAICSVPRPKRAARGAIARAETTKITVSDWWVQCKAQETGINKRRMLSGE